MLLFAFHRWGRGFSGGGAVVMNPHAMWETWVQSLGQEDSPGGGQGNPLLYPCLENPMDWGAWWATVHGVKKSWTQLSALVCTHTYTQPHTHIHTHTHTQMRKLKPRGNLPKVTGWVGGGRFESRQSGSIVYVLNWLSNVLRTKGLFFFS